MFKRSFFRKFMDKGETGRALWENGRRQKSGRKAGAKFGRLFEKCRIAARLLAGDERAFRREFQPSKQRKKCARNAGGKRK